VWLDKFPKFRLRLRVKQLDRGDGGNTETSETVHPGTYCHIIVHMNFQCIVTGHFLLLLWTAAVLNGMII
jgi:hypothetical protein